MKFGRAVSAQLWLKVILGLTALAVLGGLIASKVWSDQQDKQIMAQYSQDRHALVNKILELESSTTDRMMSDYSIWKDLAEYSKAPNETWFQENVDTVVSEYGLSGLWVQKLDGTVIHQAKRAGSTEGPKRPIVEQSGSIASTGVGKYYVWNNKELEEVRFTRLVNEDDRSALPYILVVTTPLSKERLSKLSQVLSSKLELSQTRPVKARTKDADAEFDMEVPLHGIDGQPVAWMHIDSESFVIDRLQDRALQMLVAVAVGLFGLVFVMSIVLNRYVALPKEELARALRTNDPTSITGLASQDGTFNEVATLLGARAEKDHLQEINLELEGLALKQTENLKSVMESTVLCYLETVAHHPELLTQDQRAMLDLAMEFSPRINLSQQAREALRLGMLLHFCEENDGYTGMKELDPSVVAKSAVLQPVCEIATNTEAEWLNPDVQSTVQARVFAVVRAWVAECSELDLSLKQNLWKASDRVSCLAGQKLDPKIVSEFLAFIVETNQFVA